MIKCVWIHQKCASAGDEVYVPVSMVDQCCQYCGVFGRVMAHISDGQTPLVADESGALVGKREAGESIPLEDEVPIEDVIEQVGIEVLDDLVVEISEPVEEAVIEAEAPKEVHTVGGNEFAEAETLTDGQLGVITESDTSIEDVYATEGQEVYILTPKEIHINEEPDNETLSLDEQIAALQAKKDALEANE